MDLRLRNFMVLALLLVSLHLFSTDPATPQPRQQAWAVLNSGLAHTKAPHRVEAVSALSLVTGEHSAVKFALHALEDDNPDVRAIEMPPKYPTIADQAPDHHTRPSKISHVIAVLPVP